MLKIMKSFWGIKSNYNALNKYEQTGTDTDTDRQMHKQTDKQTNKQIDKQIKYSKISSIRFLLNALKH